jgi:hypothetical protein
VNLFQLPSGISASFPSGWSGSNPYNGYFLTLQNYSDSASAAAGVTTNAPTAAVASSGPNPTIWYWNGSGYSSISGSTLNSAGSITPAAVAAGPRQLGTGPNRRWYCAHIIPGAITRGGALAASTSTPRTSATGLMGSPITGSVQYALATYNNDPGTCPATPGASGGTLNVNLTVSLDFGSLTARTKYRPAPSGG